MNTGTPEPMLITEKRKFQLEEVILIVLLILSLVGIGITDYSPAQNYWYWIGMFGVFSIAAVLIGWLQAKRQFKDFKRLFLEQIFHWTSSMLIVGAMFALMHADRLYPASAGLVIMLILALSTFLDGLRIGWRFSMNGLFLGVSAVIIAYIQRFMWIEILLALGIAAITFLVQYWRERRGTI